MDQDSRRTGRPARRTGWVSFNTCFYLLMLLHLVRATTGAELTIIEIMTSRIYHRFTLDEKDKVQALRLFKVNPRLPLIHIVVLTHLFCISFPSIGRT
jgi:hypothetical protein